ncbi:uncharacterized protein LOC104873423 [Fukomys damarensis]|uniref:uncharacterized protein LOC104873423 n=1 Tax=Fukomys damarensis TaxID=885580 RepID=UPI001455A4BB|nr:uncharacterized protein LOC104873423 [Fukomys damarensis]
MMHVVPERSCEAQKVTKKGSFRVCSFGLELCDRDKSIFDPTLNQDSLRNQYPGTDSGLLTSAKKQKLGMPSSAFDSEKRLCSRISLPPHRGAKEHRVLGLARGGGAPRCSRDRQIHSLLRTSRGPPPRPTPGLDSPSQQPADAPLPQPRRGSARRGRTPTRRPNSPAARSLPAFPGHPTPNYLKPPALGQRHLRPPGRLSQLRTPPPRPILVLRPVQPHSAGEEAAPLRNSPLSRALPRAAPGPGSVRRTRSRSSSRGYRASSSLPQESPLLDFEAIYGTTYGKTLQYNRRWQPESRGVSHVYLPGTGEAGHPEFWKSRLGRYTGKENFDF